MAELKTIKTAIIGSGMISRIYIHNLHKFFKITEVVGCADVVPERSKKRAEEFGIKQMTDEEIYNDPEIKIVVNLTDPLNHYQVSKESLNAGKCVYSEKMMAVTLAEGEELFALARQKNLLFTVAPDTFLGGGHQTARWIIDQGMIGKPILVSAVCQRGYHLDGSYEGIGMNHKDGGGIPFDMGGYYLHCLINLFGPITKAGGFAQIRDQDRKFTNPHSPRYMDNYHETTINTMSASLQFKSGVLGSLIITSESVWGGSHMQKVEVIGTEGVLCMHDPNDFFGSINVKRPGNQDPLTIPYTHAFSDNDYRGLGVVDMAYSLKNNRKPRADASIGLMAFETIHKVWKSTETGQVYDIATKTDRPLAMTPSAMSSQSAEGLMDHR